MQCDSSITCIFASRGFGLWVSTFSVCFTEQTKIEIGHFVGYDVVGVQCFRQVNWDSYLTKEGCLVNGFLKKITGKMPVLLLISPIGRARTSGPAAQQDRTDAADRIGVNLILFLGIIEGRMHD